MEFGNYYYLCIKIKGMSKYVVRQPNGLYCYYSDSFHEIWACNCTENQMAHFLRSELKKTQEEAMEIIRRDIAIFGWETVMDDWHYRFYPDAVAVMEKRASECSAIFWPRFTDFLYSDDD